MNRATADIHARKGYRIPSEERLYTIKIKSHILQIM